MHSILNPVVEYRVKGKQKILFSGLAANQRGTTTGKLRYGVLFALAFLLRFPFIFMLACSLAFMLPCTFAFAFAGLAEGLGEVTAVALVFVLVFWVLPQPAATKTITRRVV